MKKTKMSSKIPKAKKAKSQNYKDPLRHFHPATSVILAGYRSGLSQYSVKPPLFRTSTFEFPNAKTGELFFKRAYHLEGDDGEDPGLVYSRLNNPNVEICEDKIVAAEVGASHALLFPSGMSSISTTLMALLPQGAKILYSDPVYGGTYFFLKHMCPSRFGMNAVPVDTSDLKTVKKVLREEGPFDMVYLESPTNPTMKLCDIKLIGDEARKMNPNCLLAVDNTFMGPVFQSPFLFGADLVFYSATKFLGGHSDILAGVVLSRQTSLHRAIQDFRTILGATPAPDTAWLLTRSIETLWVRMQRQSEKATKVFGALKKHPKVKEVYFPGHTGTTAQRTVYKNQCRGPGSMISFDLYKNSRKTAFKFLDSLKVFHLAVSLGGTESLIQHPRSMTHSDMTLEDLDRARITEGLIRVSVGLESSEDLIEDLFQALDQI